ncbi:hypothetical protein [Janthinobacterium sp. LB3P112]|uniref:hypothetical protein n=1 Tax=Janthinobacterium sp. LB3P112 TaxID=3424196 RepID=UPI003F203CF5
MADLTPALSICYRLKRSTDHRYTSNLRLRSLAFNSLFVRGTHDWWKQKAYMTVMWWIQPIVKITLEAIAYVFTEKYRRLIAGITLCERVLLRRGFIRKEVYLQWMEIGVLFTLVAVVDQGFSNWNGCFCRTRQRIFRTAAWSSAKLTNFHSRQKRVIAGICDCLYLLLSFTHVQRRLSPQS